MPAKYLTKYISKNLAAGGRGLHRYKRPREIKKPQEVLLLSYGTAQDAEWLPKE